MIRETDGWGGGEGDVGAPDHGVNTRMRGERSKVGITQNISPYCLE